MCGGGLGDLVGKMLKLGSFNTIDITKQKAEKPKTVLSPTTYSNDAKEADEKAIKAREDAKKKAQQMLGRKSTILTGSEGLSTQAATVKKTLLGS